MRILEGPHHCGPSSQIRKQRHFPLDCKDQPKPTHDPPQGLVDRLILGALNYQVQHFWEIMLHGKNLPAVEY